MAGNRVGSDHEAGIADGERMKLIAIQSGGDWTDASVDHLLIPSDLNLSEAKKQYRAWYQDVYVPNIAAGGFLTFAEYLKQHCGAHDPDTGDIEIFDEDEL